jgi:hypothetical protein
VQGGGTPHVPVHGGAAAWRGAGPERCLACSTRTAIPRWAMRPRWHLPSRHQCRPRRAGSRCPADYARPNPPLPGRRFHRRQRRGPIHLANPSSGFTSATLHRNNGRVHAPEPRWPSGGEFNYLGQPTSTRTVSTVSTHTLQRLAGLAQPLINDGQYFRAGRPYGAAIRPTPRVTTQDDRRRHIDLAARRGLRPAHLHSAAPASGRFAVCCGYGYRHCPA